MTAAQEILDLARAEIGTKATGQNNVKYNTAYYGRTINTSGYAWCACFVWWCFAQTGASALYYGGNKTAYCPTLMSYHKAQGQAVTSYQPGDIIFFNFSGGTNAAHVGICESWDGTNVTTIDGNTSSASEANGGTVARKVRAKKYIVGGYRPKYDTELEEDTVTQDQFNQMMGTYLAQKAAEASSDWAKDGISEAITEGISDGTRPQSFATRQEVMQMMVNLGKQ